MRILLAEDDRRLGQLVKHMLERQKCIVDWVQSGDMAYEYAMYDAYEVVILDWMMPVESGIDACRRLRRDGYGGAILLLTARDGVADRVAGLDAGADDYLVKPFEFVELQARLRALARRSALPLQQDMVRIGAFVLNRSDKTLSRQGREIRLSAREFQIFDLLAQNIGIVVPREVILDRVWGLESEVSSNNIDSYIKMLRRKLENGAGSVLIHTARGVGYRLEARDV